jgi:hypothetical protein
MGSFETMAQSYLALTKDGVERAAGRIFLMPFFPSSSETDRATVVDELLCMVQSDAEALWLAYRLVQVFTKGWPGIGEMRALYCKRFKPKDGIELYSQQFPDGFPSEKQLGPIDIPDLGAFDTKNKLAAGRAPLQIEAPREQMSADKLQEFHAETIGALMQSQAPIQPGQRDLLQAKRVAAILDNNGEEAARITRQLARPTPKERRDIRAAERQIAEAKPTLTEEDKARRMAEIETGLTKLKSA